MTLEEKIAEISIDAKQAEQIKVLFDCAFAMGIAFHEVAKVTPNHPEYDNIKTAYMALIPDEQIISTFDAIMDEYEKLKSSNK